MRYKRIISALAVLLIAAGLFSSSSCDEQPEEAVVDAFDKSGGEHSAYQIDEYSEAAAHFKAESGFREIRMNMPGFSDDKGSQELRLYKWDLNYERTLKGEPAASRVYADFKDSSVQTLTFDPLPAGEYLLVAMNGRGGVGVWTYRKRAPNIDVYRDGKLSSGSMEFSVVFVERENAGFGKITTESYPAGQNASVPDGPDDFAGKVDRSEYSLTDGLGRTFDTFGAIPGRRDDRAVGIFYWPWHYSFTGSGAYSINDLMLEYPEAANDYHNPVWKSYLNSKGFWNEPLYGFYSTLDRWVLRRHAELLADADIDCVIFDCTNGNFTWRRGYETMAEVFLEAMEDGVDAPRFVFMCNFVDGKMIAEQLNSIYEDFYSDPKYRPLWFRWKGKPLILADASALDVSNAREKEISEFFNFRAPDPSYFHGPSRSSSAWGWLSVYPQTAYTDPDGKVEEITVGVAQNASGYGLVAMNDPRGGVHGRSFTDDPYYSYTYKYNGSEITADPSAESSALYGFNFQEQWDRAIEADPEFIFVTGWNEWVADRYEEWQGTENGFPDTFNDEYSRDIEPTKGALADYYYTQLCINVRRYKGGSAQDPDGAYRTIDLARGAGWDGAKTYNDYTDDYPARDAYGYKDRKYGQQAPRNDIVLCSVACGEEYLYFRAETAKDLELPDGYDEGWMRLFIDTGESGDSCGGFEYTVYTVDGAEDGSAMTLFRASGGRWSEIVCDVGGRVDANSVTVAVPRSAINAEGDEFSVSFKWIDCADDGDPLAVYSAGDAAPGSRFAYLYVQKITSARAVRDGARTHGIQKTRR